VDLNNHFPGRLLWISASLLFFLSNEVAKWQFPIHAASEKLALLASAVRSSFWTTAVDAARR